MNERDTTSIFEQHNNYHSLLDNMKGGAPVDLNMGQSKRRLCAPPSFSAIFFSQLFRLHFYFSFSSSFSFRHFHIAHLFLLALFSIFIFWTALVIQLEMVKEAGGAMESERCSDTSNHGHPEKFSPDRHRPGFLLKPVFDAPLPRIFAWFHILVPLHLLYRQPYFLSEKV